MRLLSILLLSTCAAVAQPQLSESRRPEPGRYLTPDLKSLAGPKPADLRPLLEWFAADERNFELFYDVAISPARSNVLSNFYSAWLNGLEKLDYNTLASEARIDYVLFRNKLHRLLQQLNSEQQRFSEIQPLLPFATSIVNLKEARQRVDPLDPKQAATTLVQITKQLDEVSKWVRSSAKPEDLKLSPTMGRRAVQTIAQLRSYLEQWNRFYTGYDPLFSWWVAEPYKKLDKNLETYSALVREKVAGLKKDDKDTILGDPIGRTALMAELRSEMINYNPEELIDIANKEFAWCEKEMLRASRDLGFGDDWRKALEHVKTLHVPPGQQPALIMQQATEAAEFMTSHDLLTIPPLAMDTWRVQMMTPEAQRLNPFFLGGESIIISFPTDTMSQEDKMMSMRGNNIHFSRATVHHELIPGHRLQSYMTARYRPYRQAFATPFWTEGWSLYWELQLWDMGFPKTAENRIGMLFWRMHRCARIIFSLNFHLGKMTAQECVDFLVNKVGHEYENAAGEVRRSFESNYSPLYQCAYMLGGLQIRALHRELVVSGKMKNREFHDAVLKTGRIPIEMVRASLTGRTVEKDFVANWKFYQGF